MNACRIDRSCVIYRVSLGLVYLACSNVCSEITLVEELLQAATPRGRRRMIVWIVGLEKIVYILRPASSLNAVARNPSVRSVNFIHQKPYCQRTTIAPSRDEI